MNSIPIVGAGSVLVAALPSLYRQGLLATFSEHWPKFTLEITADVCQLPLLVRQQSYALVVLDGTLGGLTLPQLLRQLRGIRSGQPLLVLTGQRLDAELRQHLLQAGAGALLPRNAAPAAAVTTIRELLSSGTTSVSSRCSPPRRSSPPTPFSCREVEVLRLVVADYCNQEIADRLCLSVRTVESHRRTLLQKTGAKTLVGLVVQAMREGWVAVA